MDWKSGFPLLTAGVAMIMDIKDTRVDNGWLLFMLNLGFWARIYMEGWRSILSFIPGMLCPFAILWFLYYFRMLGPGDIKLFCVIGSMIGVRKIGCLMLYSLFIGGFLSILLLLFCTDIKERVRYLVSYVQNYLYTGMVKPYYRKGMQIENFHFTVPIFLSTVLYAGGLF